MLIDFGVRVNDYVIIPMNVANVLRSLPNGEPIKARVVAVKGPITTLETEYGDIQYATISVLGWYK